MTSRKYTDKDGVERTSWDVTLNEMEMLDTKDRSGGAAAGPGMDDVSGDDIPF
jgi:single-stranded DNA-binding protein